MSKPLEEQIHDLKDKLARAAHERDEYRKLYELDSIELERLRRHIFGQKAEHVDPGQMQLAFDAIVQMLAGAAAPTDAATPADADVPSSPDGGGAAPGGASGGGGKGRKTTPHGRQKLPEHLPVERIELLPPVGDHRVPRRIGEDRGHVIAGVHRSPPAPTPIWAALAFAA
ncbi:hypothetical protein WMF04_37555 [Sorangium sp. So ce260]|uniref:IS66 family transposase n=1 Tax=Sorangium sp. So ce260 TaxID=3133291 RepID=UPI003F641260